MLFSKQNMVTMGAIIGLIVVLGILHAPGINWFGSLDREHDVWGGLFVEMIGVGVEIGLILLVLNGMQEGRWGKARSTINDQLFQILDDHQDHLRIVSSRMIMNDTKLLLLELTAFTEKLETVKNEYRDFLQFMSSALTPEVAAALADVFGRLNTYLMRTRSEQKFLDGVEGPDYRDISGEHPERMNYLLSMNLVWMSFLEVIDAAEPLHPLKAAKLKEKAEKQRLENRSRIIELDPGFEHRDLASMFRY